jgi:hypothetical protein
VNARVVTGDPARPCAGAMALVGGRIAAVGDEARAAVGPRAAILDAGGATVLPGFIDAHVHLLALARQLAGVDLSGVRSSAELSAVLRAADRALPPGAWLRAYGYDEHCLTERRHPDRELLDRVTRERPARIRHRTRHASVLNSAALGHVARRAPELLRAPGVERDARTGAPTGILYDLDGELTPLLPRPGHHELARDIAHAGHRLLAAGVTAVDDAGATNGPEERALVGEALAAGMLRQRIRMLWGARRHGLPADPTVTGVKLMLREDGEPDAEFRDLLMEAHRRGLQVAVHAVEGTAIATALAAFEEALGRWPRPHRHRLEHCALCPPPLMERIAALGLGVVVQPGFLHQAGEKYVADVAASERDWLYPLRSFLARGISVAGSSDAPVGPLEPLVAIAAAVGRRTVLGSTVGASESLSLDRALDLYGSGAARMTLGDHRGRIRIGAQADLVILGADLLRTPPEDLPSVPLHAVIVNGRVVWSGDDGPAPVVGTARGAASRCDRGEEA